MSKRYWYTAILRHLGALLLCSTTVLLACGYPTASRCATALRYVSRCATALRYVNLSDPFPLAVMTPKPGSLAVMTLKPGSLAVMALKPGLALDVVSDCLELRCVHCTVFVLTSFYRITIFHSGILTRFRGQPVNFAWFCLHIQAAFPIWARRGTHEPADRHRQLQV